jgi:asparagine synthase (glutamine-hydrolysing)
MSSATTDGPCRPRRPTWWRRSGSIQDPVYAGKLQRAAREQLPDSAHPVFGLVSRDWLTRATAPGAEVTPDTRRGIERTMDLGLWLDMYQPTLKLS